MKNVILLTIDTLRKDVLGCYGGGNLSPFIDSLQGKSIRFTNAHSSGPYTQASFPGILTSSYYLDFGKQKMLSPKRTMISEVLQRNGIVTAAFHSNAYLSAYFGWNRGFTQFYDSMDTDVTEKYPYIKAHELYEKVTRWLKGYDSEKNRLFLWMHFMDVHEPYIPERKYVDYVDPSIMLSEDEMFDLFNNVLLKRDVSDPGNVETLKKLYMAHVKEVDDGIRDLFGILEKFGILKESVVIITSDHGDEFGEHGGLSHDGKFFNELVNVPLILFDPRLTHGITNDAVVSSVDIAPTVVYLFGLPPETAFAGQSLLPYDLYESRGAFGEAVDKRGSRETGKEKDTYYYREGDLKIIYVETDDSWQLYDLKDDPKELKNIVGNSPHAERMKEKLRPRIKRYVSSPA